MFGKQSTRFFSSTIQLPLLGECCVRPWLIIRLFASKDRNFFHSFSFFFFPSTVKTNNLLYGDSLGRRQRTGPCLFISDDSVRLVCSSKFPQGHIRWSIVDLAGC